MGSKLLLLALIAAVAVAIPAVDQMLLTNSLIVGRTEDLVYWICNVCDDTNKPLHSHYIEENEKDIKCILSVYPNYVVLAFRYTNTALNVWQDVLYPLQVEDDNTCKGCKVQKVYNNMWNTIRDNVTSDLRAIQAQTKHNTLYITGISLGGGLAGISFIDIRVEHIFTNLQVTTFGAPRVGNKNWAAFFDSVTNNKSLRYIVKDDPITVLPSCLTLLCNYKQTGIQIVCVEATQICSVNTVVPESLASKAALIKNHVSDDIKNMRSIMDHVEGYPKIYNFTVVGL